MGPLLIAVLVSLIPLLLLARCSHWTFRTQKKLDDTNALLAQVLAELRKPKG